MKNCNKTQYWTTIVLSGFLLELIVFYHFGLTWHGGAAAIFTAVLMILALIDWQYQCLPNVFTFILMCLGLIFNAQALFVTFDQAIIGMVGGYTILWCISELFYLFTQKIGIGRGDVKLFSAIGAWVGWYPLSWVMAAAALSGLLLMLWLVKDRGYDIHKPIPFGPFLAAAGWGALCFI